MEQWKATPLFTVVLLFSLNTSVVSIGAVESSSVARLLGSSSGAHSSPRLGKINEWIQKNYDNWERGKRRFSAFHKLWRCSCCTDLIVSPRYSFWGKWMSFHFLWLSHIPPSFTPKHFIVLKQHHFAAHSSPLYGYCSATYQSMESVTLQLLLCVYNICSFLFLLSVYLPPNLILALVFNRTHLLLSFISCRKM